MTAWDARTGYRGPLIALLESLLETFYPPASSVRRYQAWLDRELSAGAGPFPCRAFATAVCDARVCVAPKVNFFREHLPFALIASDNEPSTSLFAACRAEGDLPGHTMLSALQSGVITLGILTEEKTQAASREAFARLRIRSGMNDHPARVALHGLKLCHIADAAKGLEAARPTSLRDELQVRVFRTLSPLNVFPFPHPGTYTHVLDGRRFKDLGEDSNIQQLFASVLHRHLQRCEGGGELSELWFLRARPGYDSASLSTVLRRFGEARVELTPKTEVASQFEPALRPGQLGESPPVLLVRPSALQRLAAAVRTRPQEACASKFVLRTDREGWRFEVEYPTTAKLAALLAQASSEGLRVQNRGRSGRKKGAAQFGSQFGGCYLVQTSAWQAGWNYLE